MTWRMVTMLNERKQFILEATNPSRGITFLELCSNYNISPKTGYKWLKRFRNEGNPGLEDLSRAPITNSNKISDEVERIIISIRTQYPNWGPKKIYAELKN